MTPEEIRARVAAIDASDPEAAHGDEDDIRSGVLEAIAEGHPDPAAIAKAALETRGLDFPRWYA